MGTSGRYVHKRNENEFRELLISRYGSECKSLRAYEYLCANMNKDKGYTRKYGGENYYVHPQAVAEILIDIVDADDECVSVALLHDCIEDLEGDVEGEMRRLFGGSITDKTLLVTKKKDVDYHSEEALRSYLMGTLAEEDAVLVKIADRMNNNSTLSGASAEKRARKTAETVEFFIPLAEAAAEKYPRNLAFYKEAIGFFGENID